MDKVLSLDPYKNEQNPQLVNFDKETLSLLRQLNLNTKSYDFFSRNLELIKKESQGR